MSGDVHVRFCERLGVRFPRATRLVICCRYARDAERIRKALGKRLAKYHLALNEEKTRLVPFARPNEGKRKRRAVFDFLGFTFYWGRSRRGHPIPKVKTSGKRLRAALKRVQLWARAMRSRERLLTLWRIFCTKVRGHLRYYGVSFNHRALGVFVYHATRTMYKWLNRRSQRRSYNWEQFRRFIAAHPLPRPVICHPLF